MRKILVLLAALTGITAQCSATESDIVFNAVSQSIVSVFTQGGSKANGAFGSGVTIGPALIVTNCHVIARNAGIWVHHNGTYYRGESTSSDPRRDLCLLRAPGLTAPAVKIGSSTSLRQGQSVWALGAPKTLEQTISTGIVAGLRPIDGANIIRTNTPVFPGSSGSGLFNARAELVGLVTATSKSGANIQFAVPAEWIHLVGQPRPKEGFRPPVSILEEAVNIEPGNGANAAVITAIAGKDDFFDSNPKLSAERYEKARKIMANGNWERLRGYAEEWTELDPKSVDAWMFVGHAHFGLKEGEEALEAFATAVKLDAENAIAHYYLGNTYAFFGKNEEALASYKEAQRLNPRDKIVRENIEMTEAAIARAKKAPHSTIDPEIMAEKVVQKIIREPDYEPTPEKPGMGKAMLIFLFLYLLAGLGIYLMYLVNKAQPWGTPYPVEMRKGASILALAIAIAMFLPVFMYLF